MFSYFVKVEDVSHVIVCLAVEISKQSVEGAACLFLNPESKMQKERDEERVVKQKGIKTWRFYCQKKKKERERNFTSRILSVRTPKEPI